MLSGSEALGCMHTLLLSGSHSLGLVQSLALWVMYVLSLCLWATHALSPHPPGYALFLWVKRSICISGSSVLFLSLPPSPSRSCALFLSGSCVLPMGQCLCLPPPPLPWSFSFSGQHALSHFFFLSHTPPLPPGHPFSGSLTIFSFLCLFPPPLPPPLGSHSLSFWVM